MRKKLKGIALLSAGIMLVGSMLVMPKLNMNTVLAADSESTTVIEPIGVKLSTTDINELWVDDIVYFKSMECTKIEIIEGDCIEVFDGMELGIRCIKEGEATFKAYFTKGEISGATTYRVKVVRGEDVEVTTREFKMKIGESIRDIVKFTNLRYGSTPHISVDKEARCFFTSYGFGGWLGTSAGRDEPDVTIFDNGEYAYYPGTVNIQFYCKKNNLTADKSAIDVGTGRVIIEEPYIETNMPEIVAVGTDMQFETKLSNICTEDTGAYLRSLYEPEITVLEGQDCIKQTEEVYSDFETKSKIEFVKSGVVKIQIKYVADINNVKPDSEEWQLLSYISEDADLYTAEKTVTIRVADEKEEIVKEINEIEVTDISKEALTNALENGNTVEIRCNENNILKYSWLFAPQNIKSVVDVNLKISFAESDKEIEKKYDGKEYFVMDFKHSGNLPDNTTVKIKMPDKFENVTKLYVYHLESNGKIQLYAEEIANNGYLMFNLTHCSKYFVTSEKIETTENKDNVPTIEETTQTSTDNIKTETPNTGDDSLMIIYILVLVAAVSVLFIMSKEKNKWEF